MFPSTVPSQQGRLWGWPKDVAIGVTQQQSSGVIRRTIEYPEAGVWEIVVEHEGAASPELRMKRQTAAIFSLNATVTRVTGGIPSGDNGMAGFLDTPTQLVLHNALAPVTARIVGALASVARDRLSLRDGGAAIVRELAVDSGTTRFSVRIAHPSDSTADIDVHIFDCATGRCNHYVSAVFRGADKELRVQNPRPGRWRVVIDPYAVPSGLATVEYVDEFVHPKYGTVNVADSVVHLPFNGTRTVALAVGPGRALEPGRTREVRLEAVVTEPQTPSGPASRGGTHYPSGVLAVIRFDLPNR